MQQHTFLALAAVALCACTDTSMPGTELGTFKFTATQTSNTCGAAMAAPANWTFEAELSRDGDLLYWRQNDKLVSGPLTGNSATIQTSVTNVAIASAPGVQGCLMKRADTVTVTLPATGEVTSLSGTIAFDASIAGGDCATLLTMYGGTYDEIPCRTELSYTAERIKAP